jgi:His-Xaa-Ser system protein HxsD
MALAWVDIEIGEEVFAFTIDERIYSVEAVMRTAYWFTDRAYLVISKPSEHSLRVYVKAKPPTLESPRAEPPDDLAREFGDALLNNELREAVERQTGKIRELVIAKAFAEAGVPDDAPPGTPNDPVHCEFIKSRGNRCLVQPATMLLPAIRGKAYRRLRSARVRIGCPE